MEFILECFWDFSVLCEVEKFESIEEILDEKN